MEIALWIIAVLLAVILVIIVFKEKIKVEITVDSASKATKESDQGKLVVYGAGLLELQNGFDGPVVFFRNDNAEGLNFYLDFIAYSWHSYDNTNALTMLNIIYDTSEPDGHTFTPSPISMNQNYPNAAIDNGVFVLAWSGGNSFGMTGSEGGRGVMVVKFESGFRMIPLDGKIIIGVGGTQRFDVKTNAAGVLRLAVVGWFAKSV